MMTVHNFLSREQQQLSKEHLVELAQQHQDLKDTIDSIGEELEEAVRELKDFERRWEL